MLQAVGLLEGGFGGRIEIAGTDASDAAVDRERTTLRRDHLGFVYQFHHLLPDFSAEENVMLPQLVAGVRARAGERAGARAARRARARAPPDAPAEPAFGRRAAARRGRPRARQQAAAGARRRADRQPRRGHLGQGARRSSSSWCAGRAARRWSPRTTSGSPADGPHRAHPRGRSRNDPGGGVSALRPGRRPRRRAAPCRRDAEARPTPRSISGSATGTSIPMARDNLVAHSRIEKLYGGCAIRENWMPLNPLMRAAA